MSTYRERWVRWSGPFGFPVRTVIPGLFECGASTVSPGIHGEQVLTARSGPLRVYAAEDPTTWPQEWPLPLRMPWRDRSDGKGERAAA